MSNCVRKGRGLVTDLDLVINRQVLTGATFSQDVLQRWCTRGIRDVVV